MRCLVLSDTFPSRIAPWRGPYNRRQIECLAQLCNVTVINPIPWPRLLADRRARGLTRGPDTLLHGIPILHPAFYYLPVLGRSRTWRGILSAAQHALKQLHHPSFDVILATFAYPHGLAAMHLARTMRIPYVIKARGSDLHALPPAGTRRAHVAEVLRSADAVVAVSSTLAHTAAQLGANPDTLHVLNNGVDADRFTIIPRDAARRQLGLPLQPRIALFVGSLLPVKGIDLLLDTLAPTGPLDLASENALLVLAGAGPLRKMVEAHTRRHGLRDRLRLLGHVARRDLALWLNAADVLVLPSRNEGCPNVVLEALACGTPVVASKVGAVPDLIDETSGIMVPPGDVNALADGLRKTWQREWQRPALRSRVEKRSWQRNAHTLHGILQKAVVDATRHNGTRGEGT